MIVNLNALCKVQLNDLGKQIWLSQIDALPDEIKKTRPDIIAGIKGQIDKDSFIQLELWAIMSCFGPYINQNTLPFTSTVIELDKNPNFNPVKENQVD